MKRAEKWTEMLRFLGAGWHHGEIVNGYAPFFWRKSLDICISCSPMCTAMLRFLCDLAIKNTILATGERQYSVFLSDSQCFRRYWTDMLRFLGQFQADFLLTNGWIEPLLVGGYAPFSPFYHYCPEKKIGTLMYLYKYVPLLVISFVIQVDAV